MFENQFFWKLWDAANVVTGFAAVQSLAFAFIFIPKGIQIDSAPTFNSMVICLMAGCLVYCAGVYFLIRWAKSLLVPNEKMGITETNMTNLRRKVSLSAFGRIFAIVFFTGIDICVVYLIG